MSHFPPGTSTWNKIEHRLFSFIIAGEFGGRNFAREVPITPADKHDHGIARRARGRRRGL